MELYDVKIWVKFITEGTYIAYSPINSPPIKNLEKKVPTEGEEEMHLTLVANLFKNINKARAQG